MSVCWTTAKLLSQLTFVCEQLSIVKTNKPQDAMVSPCAHCVPGHWANIFNECLKNGRTSDLRISSVTKRKLVAGLSGACTSMMLKMLGKTVAAANSHLKRYRRYLSFSSNRTSQSALDAAE